MIPIPQSSERASEADSGSGAGWTRFGCPSHPAGGYQPDALLRAARNSTGHPATLLGTHAREDLR